jgi:dTMP kinase
MFLLTTLLIKIKLKIRGSMMKKVAKIITIEGTDCSGKETQSKLLLEKLIRDGYKVKMYSFPQYELPTGKIVGECLMGRLATSFFEEGAANVDPLISALYFAANRREAFLKYIEKEIYKNDLIILDRYTTSNLGHQAGKGKTKAKRNKLYKAIIDLEYGILELPKPDMTIFLHMPYKAISDLKFNRLFTDDLESSDKYLIDSERSYLDLVKKFKWNYIYCLKTEEYVSKESIKPIEKINDEIYNIVIKNLNDKTINKNKMTRY